MYLLLSGEGPTDIGACNTKIGRCESDDFILGPMAVMVDQLVSHRVDQVMGYELSHIESELVGFVHKNELASGAASLKRNKKAMKISGKKTPKETLYYRNNARVLAKIAKAKAIELGNPVVAVLFRDADGTASAARGHQQHKWDSMLKGFTDEAFVQGVPMIPMPKSEAWLLCGVKENPYQDCSAIENESGNDRSLNPLKKQLSDVLNNDDSALSLADKVKNREIDVNRIDMPSFNQFKIRLEEVVRDVVGVAK